MVDEVAWQDFVARQEVVVAMRFSYFGSSGWKGDVSKQKEMLLDPARLKARLAILKSLGVPSLAAQSDQNYHLMVLCSEDMPAPLRAELEQVCSDGLGADRASVCPRPFGRASKHLLQFVQKRYGKGPVIQTVLDDDDAFATDLIACARRELAQLPADLTDAEAMRFVSFANGYGLDINDRKEGAADQADFPLYTHRYPWINLGLTMVSHSTGKNLYSIAHQKTPTLHPSRLVKGSPMFVRTLNGLNDSRIEVTDRWKPIEDWRGNATVLDRFAYLSAI